MNKDTLLEEVRKLEFSLNLAEQNSDIDRYLADDVWHLIDCINKLEEPQKPVIPQFVADYIELNKGWNEDRQEYIEDDNSGLWFALNGDSHGMPNSVSDWLFNEENVETFARAWLYGYEAEKEPIYYAKIKGHEFIQRIPTFDEDTGENTSDYYRSIYFVLQSDGDLIVDMKDSGLSGAKNVMTMSQWNNLGINDSNADFEEVE